jgi:hypothetical protein
MVKTRKQKRLSSHKLDEYIKELKQRIERYFSEKKSSKDDVCTTSHLCKDSLGIPRILMPAIENPDEFLKRMPLRYTRTTAKVDELKPAQGEIRDSRVDGVDLSKPADPIIISQDNYIVDGHHRWAAAHKKGHEYKSMKVIRIHAPFIKIMYYARHEPTNPF